MKVGAHRKIQKPIVDILAIYDQRVRSSVRGNTVRTKVLPQDDRKDGQGTQHRGKASSEGDCGRLGKKRETTDNGRVDRAKR